MSDSSWPQGLRPSRLLHPWGFPGKSTEVGWVKTNFSNILFNVILPKYYHFNLHEQKIWTVGIQIFMRYSEYLHLQNLLFHIWSTSQFRQAIFQRFNTHTWGCGHCVGECSPQFSSVQFISVAQSCPTLWPHESHHARSPCPSPTPGVLSDSRPSSQWCHPAISSSVVPFSSCPQSLPASGSFPMSQLLAWGGQSTGVSASATVLPMKILVDY